MPCVLKVHGDSTDTHYSFDVPHMLLVLTILSSLNLIIIKLLILNQITKNSFSSMHFFSKNRLIELSS